MHRALVLVVLVLAVAALAPMPGFAAVCTPSVTRLCLQDSRFAVEVAWTLPGGGSGVGHSQPMTKDTGLFWFFSDSNLELVVKVLDGRAINGHFWVYYGGLSDVEYTITVTDVRNGVAETYHNPASRLASGADVSAFTAEPAPGGGDPGVPGAPPAVLAPLRQGSERQVNVTTPGMQRSPDVAVSPDGGSLVVWSGDTPLPAGGRRIDIYGRFYDAQGNPRGGETRLNETETDQIRARVAAAPAGGFMVVWTNGSRITARVYGADGQPRSGEIVVSANAGFQVPAAVAADTGGFLVVWVEGGGLNSGQPSEIRGQRFDVQGSRVGGEVLVSDPAGGISRDQPRVAASPVGGFVAAWIEESADVPGETDVAARRLDGVAHPLGHPFLLTAVDFSSHIRGIHLGAVPLFHSDGGFSVIWTTYGSLLNPPTPDGMFARRYSSTGAGLGSVIELRPHVALQTPAVTLLPSGDALVLWEEWGVADPDGGILARVFDSFWKPRGAEFRINTYTDRNQTEPAVARDASGHLLAVWSSGVDYSPVTPPAGWGTGTQDGSFFGVFGQSFTTATCALSSDQLCLNGRFRVGVQFTRPPSGALETAHAVPLTSDTGAFWFFGQDNLELMIKVLDGRALNGHFWVYAGALSDVAYTITITDTETGQVKTYRNDPGHLASRSDVEAF